MLIPGTEMHLATFCFICVELVILSCLCIYRLARKEDKRIRLDIFLCIFLLLYNITGGLLPDPKLPGGFFVQEAIAYATGFLTPCYFPYYAYKSFRLEKMHFHAFYGIFIFLVLPYFAFLAILKITGDLNFANEVLIVPVLYSIWVLSSVYRAVRFKYGTEFNSSESREELVILMFCLSPWIGLPIITYFNLNQTAEAITTNTGFLLLLALHIKQMISKLRMEYLRLIDSERNLTDWNKILQQEVEKRTKEIENLTREEKFKFNCSRFGLTQREQQIAFLVFTGGTYKQVAEQLFIAERTVAKHIQNIFEKIHVTNRSELCHKLAV